MRANRTATGGWGEKGERLLRILIAIGVPRQKEAGAAGVVLNHATELRKLGHQVECWFLEDVLKEPVKWKRFEAWRFAREVSRRIQREAGKYEVANLHAPWGCVYGLWRSRNRRSAAPPYVLTMQGSEERYVEAMRREDRKGRAAHFGWKNRLWHRLYHQTMYDLAIRTADYGAVANRDAQICAESKYRRKPGLFWFVPNGTEERFFTAREYPEKTQCDLLFVGTWLDRKGVYYLAEAFETLAKNFPGMRLTVAGSSVSAEEVKKMFTAEVRERVAVIPLVKREDAVELYRKHAIFVFPSLVEGMPLTLLEAMATGMPVVTTNTFGMADVVEDDVNGLLVPPADANRLAEGVGRLWRSTELRKRLGTAARETMRGYTWERVTRRLESVFKLAIEAENRRRA